MKYLIYFFMLFSPAAIFSRALHGTLQGYVMNQKTGEDLDFATVSVFQEGKLIWGTTTTDDGYYTMKLPIGSYAIEATYIGFEQSGRVAISIIDNQTTPLDFSLISGLDLPLVVISSTDIERCGIGCTCYSLISCDAYPRGDKIENTSNTYIKQALDITVFPNPSAGKIFIDRKSNVILTSLALFDVKGREISLDKNASIKKQINIAHLQNGIYYLVYQTESNELQSIPIVKIE